MMQGNIFFRLLPCLFDLQLIKGLITILSEFIYDGASNMIAQVIMFGIKTKAKTNTSYPETFYLDFEYITMAMDYETRNFLERLSCNIPYKGRYIDSYGVKVELEQFQGIKLSSNYFRTEPNP